MPLLVFGKQRTCQSILYIIEIGAKSNILSFKEGQKLLLRKSSTFKKGTRFQIYTQQIPTKKISIFWLKSCSVIKGYRFSRPEPGCH